MKEKIKDKERIAILEKVIYETFWMARRYAHGRHTFSPSTVRDCFYLLKNLGIKIPEDHTIKAPEHELNGMDFLSDYLHDLK